MFETLCMTCRLLKETNSKPKTQITVTTTARNHGAPHTRVVAIATTEPPALYRGE